MRYLTIIKDGRTIDHRDMNIELLYFRRSSLMQTNNTISPEGRHGLLDNGTKFEGRKLTAGFLVRGRDIYDYDLKVDEIYDLFATEDSIILIDSIQPGKQWEVKVASDFTIEPLGASNSQFSVEFTSFSPYAKSVATSLKLHDGPKQIGMGLLPVDLMYTFREKTFKVYNAGVVTVDPYEMPLVIQFKGASTNLIIKNKTTGEFFQYNGTSVVGDVIELNKVRHLKNNVSIFSTTNHQTISLKSGWNEFEILGAAEEFTISFDFQFYYK